MSIEMIQLVMWGYPDTKARDVYLILAEHADDRGENIFPSVERMAKIARVGKSQVHKGLRHLREGKWIFPVANKGGGKPGTTVVYRINCRKLYGPACVMYAEMHRGSTDGLLYTPVEKDTPRKQTGRQKAPDGSPTGAEARENAPDGSPGCASTPLQKETLTAIEPSLNPSFEPPRSGGTGARAGEGAPLPGPSTTVGAAIAAELGALPPVEIPDAARKAIEKVRADAARNRDPAKELAAKRRTT